MKKTVVWGSAVLAATLATAPVMAQTSSLLAANLLGQEVADGGGDDKASANFNGEVNLTRNTLCYYLDMDGLGSANAVHIHQKDQGGTDGPSLALQVPAPNGDETCVNGDNAVLAAIAKTPDDYYIDVHTPEHPKGAVRGALKE
jgi:hypothetical protein